MGKETFMFLTSRTGAGAGVAVASIAGMIAAATLNSYSAYLGGPAHDSYVPSATTITVANAGSVHSIWKVSALGRFNASPTVYHGIIYIGAENGTFYAINATNGADVVRISGSPGSVQRLCARITFARIRRKRFLLRSGSGSCSD